MKPPNASTRPRQNSFNSSTKPNNAPPDSTLFTAAQAHVWIGKYCRCRSLGIPCHSVSGTAAWGDTDYNDFSTSTSSRYPTPTTVLSITGNLTSSPRWRRKRVMGRSSVLFSTSVSAPQTMAINCRRVSNWRERLKIPSAPRIPACRAGSTFHHATPVGARGNGASIRKNGIHRQTPRGDRPIRFAPGSEPA